MHLSRVNCNKRAACVVDNRRDIAAIVGNGSVKCTALALLQCLYQFCIVHIVPIPPFVGDYDMDIGACIHRYEGMLGLVAGKRKNLPCGRFFSVCQWAYASISPSWIFQRTTRIAALRTTASLIVPSCTAASTALYCVTKSDEISISFPACTASTAASASPV